MRKHKLGLQIISFLFISSCSSTSEVAKKNSMIKENLLNAYENHYGWSLKKINDVRTQTNYNDYPLAYCLDYRDGNRVFIINKTANMNNRELAGAAHICEISTFYKWDYMKQIYFWRR